jgi:putative aldouronate transport system substrate-binding protein
MTKKAISKKLLSCMLILAVGSSLMAGCKKAEDTTAKKDPATSGTPAYLNSQEFPIVKEPIKLKVMGSRSPSQGPWEEMDVMKKMESMTGISFTFDTPPQASFTEKKNLTFASGSSDLPDVFLGATITINEEETYGPQGLLIPLEGLIDKYAPHIKKLLADRPDIKKAITATDGHIYSLPYIVNTKTVASNILYMDMKWLQNVGMQKPTNVDELYNVLKAFKEKDPNQNGKPDEIPISAVKTPVLQGTILTAFTGTGGMTRDGFNLKDGKVVFEPAMPEYKEYLAYLKKLYAEGLLDKETFTQTAQQMSAKGKASTVGVVTASLSSMVDPKNYNPYELLPPLTSKTNSKKVTALLPGITTGAMAITKNCKYPEAMMRWADVFYRDDNEAVQGLSGMSMFLGIRGEHWDYTDSAKTKYTRVQKDKSISAVENTMKTYTPGGAIAFPSKVITNAIPDGDPLLLLKATESDKQYFPFNVQTYPSTVRFTKSETERITFLTADIKNYTTQMEAKFIVGEESLDKWDNYIATLKKMNLDELTKIYTDGFERWNKAK